MKLRSILRHLTAAALLILARTEAAAQMSISSSAASVTLPLLSTDYNLQSGVATRQNLDAHTLTLTSDSAWVLTVQAAMPSFIYTGTAANPSKPVGDLSIRISGSWVSLSTSAQTVASGPAQGGGDPPAEVTPDYQLQSNLKNDLPGTYSVTVIWTLTAP